jgi:polysaccharide biosynthesis transport protein
MEVRQYLSLVLKWWWLMVLATGIAVVSSYLATRSMPRIYQAQATLMVGQQTQSLNPDYSSMYVAQQLSLTYAQLATTRPVLQAAIDILGLDMGADDLAGMVSASDVPNTQLLHVQALDTDPDRAAAIANGVAQALQAMAPSSSDTTLQRNREFVLAQLKDLQGKIEASQRLIPQMQSALSGITSARALQDQQQAIATEEAKLSAWNATYSSLLGFLSQSRAGSISIVDPAVPQRGPISPNTTMNVLMAAAFGLALAVGAALLLEYLDDTVKTREDVERVLGTAVLGSIAGMPPAKQTSDGLVAATAPSSTFAEAYRVLRTNVQFADLNNPATSILITSASPQEGKSTTVANLGVSLAQAGRQVIVVDADLRRPRLHTLFGLTNVKGLSNLLLLEDPVPDEFLQKTDVDGLRLLASGPIPPNPAELLGSPRMKKVVALLKQSADVVLYDSPPVLAVADAAILASRVGESVLVAQAGLIRSDVARHARDTLTKSGAKLLGVVLNRVAPEKGLTYYAYYSADGTRKERRRWNR